MDASYLLGILPHGGLHRQRRIAAPDGMVLMRDRCPEKRHDAIAQDLVHSALIAVHGFHHVAQRRV